MPDYMFLLESRLMPEQRATMMRVQELSAALGLNVYLTGGTVRDLITGATLRWKAIPQKSRANWKRVARRCCTRRRSCGISKYCSRASAKEVFLARATTTMFDPGRGLRFAGRQLWRTCDGGTFR